MMRGDGEVSVEWGDRGCVSRMEEMGRTEET